MPPSNGVELFLRHYLVWIDFRDVSVMEPGCVKQKGVYG